MHSGLSDGDRLDAWLRARNGSAQVVLGTRSAVWTPLKNPGLFIVDEEHDQSYKQQDGLRYSARDLAVLKASIDGVPIILGSATPSLESLYNSERGKFTRITLTKRAENAKPPAYRIIDMRGRQTTGALSGTLIREITRVLQQKQQVLLFQNRRGYSPVLMCHACGWTHMCTRCDIPLTYHKMANRLICHHCGHIETPSNTCGDCHAREMIQVGHGTERLYETLEGLFPTAKLLRIDRDSTRRKGSMHDYMEKINNGSIDILVGTQMLAKGHHFPKVTLVGIIDADRGLFSNDFRAGERMAQLVVQVSGRAGRARDPGLVMIQTHYPEHPFLLTLVQKDYAHFAEMQLLERKETNLPPYSYQVLLRADSHEDKLPSGFLETAAGILKKTDPGLEIFGPFPAPIEKRGGRYRFQLLVQSGNRANLHKALIPWVNELEHIRSGKKIRWSLDVDPQDLL
jgi:primosomal protein N' (replication factor Y)